MSSSKSSQIPVVQGTPMTTVQDAAASLANKALAEAIAGAGGGILSMALCYPLLNVSTRQQVQKKPAAPAAGEAQEGAKPAEAAPAQPRYGGIISAMIEIAKEEGLPGLYKGLSSALIGQTVTQFVYYWTYSATKTAAQRVVSGESLLSVLAGTPSRTTKLNELSVINNIIVGSIAGAITAVATNPIWTVNTRMMTNSKKGTETGFLETLMQLYKEEGIGGLFRGIGPALILVINPTIQYMVYSKAREAWVKGKGSSKVSALEVFFLGAVAKVAATLFTYPYILVKSNLQSQKDGSLSANDVIKRILTTEGPTGFYKGLRSKILQSVLMASFLFVFQDKLLFYTLRLMNMIRPVRAARK